MPDRADPEESPPALAKLELTSHEKGGTYERANYIGLQQPTLNPVS